jgi:hypothetical protein
MILQIICGEQQLVFNSQHKAFNTAVSYFTHMGNHMFQFWHVYGGIFLFLYAHVRQFLNRWWHFFHMLLGSLCYNNPTTVCLVLYKPSLSCSIIKWIDKETQCGKWTSLWQTFPYNNKNSELLKIPYIVKLQYFDLIFFSRLKFSFTDPGIKSSSFKDSSI